VIRYLATREEGASVDEMVIGTGLSERTLGKSIRRLVTRYYVDMPAQGFYRLSVKGKQAAQDLRMFDGDTLILPAAELESEPAPARVEPAPEHIAPPPAAVQVQPPIERQVRRLSIFMPKEMVIRSTISLRTGFEAPRAGQPALQQPARIVLRLSAPGCDVEPTERPVEVASSTSVGPLQFRVAPRLEGMVRLKLEAFQLVSQRELLPIGGMYFDLNVAGFPTPLSAEFQTLGAMVQLYSRARE
jgi:hypothetical protein